MKKAHLFRCARITRSNVRVRVRLRSSDSVARLASGRFLIRLREGAFQGNLREMILVWCVAIMLSGCAAAVATDGEIASTENPETAVASCPYLRDATSFLRRTEKSLR